MEIESPVGPLPHIPDHLTLPQFIFDYEHPLRPSRCSNIPWLIEDDTGRQIGEHEVSVAVNSRYLSDADVYSSSAQKTDIWARIVPKLKVWCS